MKKTTEERIVSRGVPGVMMRIVSKLKSLFTLEEVEVTFYDNNHYSYTTRPGKHNHTS